MNTGQEEISELLRSCAEGDAEATTKIYELSYHTLKTLARRTVRGEGADPMLQPTALLNEAFLRMPRTGEVQWTNRHHFYAIAARAMRRVLVDYARAKKAGKRPSAQSQSETDLNLLMDRTVDLDTVLAIETALSNFEQVDPQRARVVELRYFSGLTFGEIGEVVGKSEASVKKDWLVARIWLRETLGG